MLLINTVLESREGFVWWEYKGAREAQRAMHIIGFLSERNFGNMVLSNMIVNCPVTFDDVKNAKLIFSTDATSLKGKSGMRNPDNVVTDYVEIPWKILESRKELEVSTDIMFVNKLPFLVTISKGLKFTTIDYLSNKLEISLVNFINKIVNYYKSHGLYVRTMFVGP